MDYRTQRAAKHTLAVSSIFGKKKAAICQTHLEGPLERETLNVVSSIEMLSLSEVALELGNSQCVCRSLSAQSEVDKTLDFLLINMSSELFISSISPTHQICNF